MLKYVQQKHISYEFRVFAPSIFLSHFRGLCFLSNQRTRKAGTLGWRFLQKGGTAYGREEAEGEAGVQGYGIPHALLDEKNLLSLYNAVTGRSYEDAKELEIVTLDNAVYMGMKNDLAFLLDLHISLYEHQSTKNPNMPLRDLFYISLEYQKYVSDKSLYSSALLKIPAPVFIVFYNGAEDMEERTELRLSQAYEHFEGEPNLELKVRVLNINAGHNAELMEQCRMLKEYAQYVARVRGYTASMKLEEAVRRAIKECIAEGILADFLRKNRAEVEMVSILEYDKEYEEKKLRKAEYEAGEQEGLNRGLAQGIVETGCAYGVSKKEILERLQERLNISCQTAQEYFARYSGKKIS